jgi:hypothetical protein
MLIVLGLDVLRRMARQRVHFHVHCHAEGVEHLHADGHSGATQHDLAHHEYSHSQGFPARALLVGLMHGMAGSAALILLAIETVTSPVTGVFYIALFGLGSIAA